MIITQDALIRQIADRGNLNTAVVREVFRSAEEIIFNHLSTAAPSENMTVKLFSGISLERKYKERKKYSKGMFQNLDCPEHVNVKANLSSYYSRKVNEELFVKERRELS